MPDLRGRVPIHTSSTHPLSEKAANETVALGSHQIPLRTHAANAQEMDGTLPSPSNAVWAATATKNQATAPSVLVQMNQASISAAGAAKPHDNMIPFRALTFLIATEAMHPSRS